MKNNRYENGYLPKIAYHMAVGNHESVNYFTERQIARYGELTAQDMVFVSERATAIKREMEMESAEFNAHLGRF